MTREQLSNVTQLSSGQKQTVCFTECKYQEAFTSAADSDKYLPAYDVVSDSCNNVVLFPVDLFDFDSLEVEQYLTAPRENGSVT